MHATCMQTYILDTIDHIVARPQKKTLQDTIDNRIVENMYIHIFIYTLEQLRRILTRSLFPRDEGAMQSASA